MGDDGDDAVDEDDEPTAVEQATATATQPLSRTRTATAAAAARSLRRSLFKVWEAGAAEERKIIRDLALDEFFARASGSEIFDRIPAYRLDDEVCRDFLDKLTVDGMRTRMSEAFGRELRDRIPKPKSNPTKRKTLNLSANPAPGFRH